MLFENRKRRGNIVVLLRKTKLVSKISGVHKDIQCSTTFSRIANTSSYNLSRISMLLAEAAVRALRAATLLP